MGGCATGSGGITLVNPRHRHAHPRGFLGHLAGELPVRPLADLLVGLPAQTDARLDVTYISDGNPGDSLRLTVVHHLARRLMQQIPLLAVEPGGRAWR
jgi:hypothetical protein